MDSLLKHTYTKGTSSQTTMNPNSHFLSRNLRLKHQRELNRPNLVWLAYIITRLQAFSTAKHPNGTLIHHPSPSGFYPTKMHLWTDWQIYTLSEHDDSILFPHKFQQTCKYISLKNNTQKTTKCLHNVISISNDLWTRPNSRLQQKNNRSFCFSLFSAKCALVPKTSTSVLVDLSNISN